jgi:hypothetical protein
MGYLLIPFPCVLKKVRRDVRRLFKKESARCLVVVKRQVEHKRGDLTCTNQCNVRLLKLLTKIYCLLLENDHEKKSGSANAFTHVSMWVAFG